VDGERKQEKMGSISAAKIVYTQNFVGKYHGKSPFGRPRRYGVVTLR
jgi:hypothetical protein